LPLGNYFYTVFSLNTAPGCMQDRTSRGVHLPERRIYSLNCDKDSGRVSGGFIHNTSKCSRYGHSSENYGFEEPGRENC